MNVLFVASELAPYAKTGGLADVMAALPKYLLRAGHDVRIVVPLYDTIDRGKVALEPVTAFEIPLGSYRYAVEVARERSVYFVSCPELFARGSLYTTDADEHRRFLALSYAALLLCRSIGFQPDIIHAHDWQAALLPMIVKSLFAQSFPSVRTLLTIHNLNYQGSFPATIVPETNLVPHAHLFHQELLRARRVNFLLQGILYADGVSTVSPTYAQEIQTAEHGAGLDAFLRARSSTVVGILNGVDYEEWSPERDRLIPYPYSAADATGKQRNKQVLLESLGLPYLERVPVIGIVSRLAGQKGFGLLDPAMFDMLRQHGFQLVVLGSGEPALEDMFTRMQREFPRQVCFYQGFQNKLAHLIEAGADMFLMPSRYEPCGLNQM
ncbi:MAG TPA: glycogen/starch synthase, partial [Kofleriaceae bacterium]|nr:glycogen/starch synthase [Kofleriaceae bacterium]